MSPAASSTRSRLIESLDAFTRANPLARKRLVGPDVNFGRELLVSLARRTGGWVGWEATNLRGIARALAFVPLAERNVSAADDVTINALVNLALERAIAARRVSSAFAGLAPGLGFRRALLDTILELRTAGISASELRQHVAKGSPAFDLPIVLEHYEAMLAERRLADAPELFRTAIDSFEREAPLVLDGVIAIAPSREPRGLPGELLDLVIAYGARTLDTDVAWAEGAISPHVQADFLVAATPSDEIREVMRRVVAEGLRWDDVEIVATDADTYGIALDALCQRIGIGATMLQGVPLSRTRVGRALDRWFVWISDGLPADVLRQALEGGEIAAPECDVTSTQLARELRQLGIGWGRPRFEAAAERLGSGVRIAELSQREDESDSEFAERRASRARTCSALHALLAALLSATPPVPERGDARVVRSSSASLAKATMAYLALVPTHGEAEQATMTKLRDRLDALAMVDEEEVSFTNALAALRESLADLRAWPLVTSERKPWSASGGMPHFTTISHAGTTGRKRIFVVGFDADRTSGNGRQDPLLPDSVRRALGRNRLITSTERREESAKLLAAAIASLRGRVTFSYAISSSLDGREAGASPLMLEAWRQVTGDPAASYEAFRHALPLPASAVPSHDAASGVPIDARDVWLDALAENALLLDGTEVVREAFPVLAAGLDAHSHANGHEITPFHGLVPEAGAELDPTGHPHREISPSSLEMLAKCPLAWFYRYGLSLYPVREPEYEESRWLDQLQRGSLLHEVFEQFTREYQGRQDELASSSAAARIAAIAEEAVKRWRRDVPPPAETVFEAERAELRQSASAFLQMERQRTAAGDSGKWIAFELGFGRGDAKGPFTLPDGRVILTHGRADRVDEMPDGSLRVIDYKTGKATRFAKRPKSGPFNGGRQLQPALYRSAVESLTGKRVSSFEYTFPTGRGGNEIVSYTSDELAIVPAVVSALLGHVSAGEFVPTTDDGDCGYCDYQAICRAGRGKWDTTSPRAAWAKDHAESLPQYQAMLARRGQGGPGGDE